MNSRLNLCLFKLPSTYPFNLLSFQGKCIRLQLSENFEEQTPHIPVDSQELLHTWRDGSAPY